MAVWYSGALILVTLILAGASRWALAVSLDHALDQSLRHRLIGLQDFIGSAAGDELQRLWETLNQMLGEVKQALLHMRQFTADTSHKLRAPMTLVYTAAQFALRRERSGEELKEALQKILARRSARGEAHRGTHRSASMAGPGRRRHERNGTDLNGSVAFASGCR